MITYKKLNVFFRYVQITIKTINIVFTIVSINNNQNFSRKFNKLTIVIMFECDQTFFICNKFEIRFDRKKNQLFQ